MKASPSPSVVRSFPCRLDWAELIIESVRESLSQHAFECRRLTTEEGAIVLQITKRGTWRKLLGLATALTIEFHPVADSLYVRLREPSWGDKALVAGTGTFVALWPLAVTASLGAYHQWTLPQWVMALIEEQVGALRSRYAINVGNDTAGFPRSADPLAATGAPSERGLDDAIRDACPPNTL